MGESPKKVMGKGYLSILILIEGQEIPKTYHIKKIETFSQIDKIPYAKFELDDGSTREQKFEASEDPNFEPGKKVEIKVGYGAGNEKPIFKGIILKQGLKHSKYTGPSSRIIVHCKEEAFKMTKGIKSQIFYKQKDSEIISSIYSDAGLSADVETTKVKHKELVRYNCTDWEFVLTRADANGLVTYIRNGKITVKKPAISEKSGIKISYGKDLLGMNMNMDASNQYAEVGANVWNYTDQKGDESVGKKPSVNAQGDVDSNKLSSVIEPKMTTNVTPSIDKEQIQEWSNSVYQRGHLSRMQGTLQFDGTGEHLIGKTIELFGFGTRFTGDAYVSSEAHVIRDGRWITEVGIGLDARPIMQQQRNESGSSATPGGGMMPPIFGLQHGLVKQIHEDPDGEYRVQVNIFMIDNNEGDGIWARMAHYYATADCGFVFYPEVGDEVIIGFFNNDPTHAVILGSMYSSSKHKITTEEKHDPADPNHFKAISVNKGKMRIEFWDEPGKNVYKVITEDKMLIELNDDKDTITIEDPVNVNKMVMDSKGILFETNGDFVVKAQKNIKMEAKINIETKSTADTKMEATANLNAKATAQMKLEGTAGFEAKSPAMSKLEGSAMAVIKGGLVTIN